MGLEKINEELARVGAIMGRWADAREVSDIERELVLDKLKNIYEQVMFFQREEFPAEAACPGEPSVSAGDPLALEEQPQHEVVSAPQHEVVSAPQVETRPESGMELRPGPAEVPVATPARLFDMDQDVPSDRPAYDRRVILSLYGEGPAKCVAASEKTVAEPVQAPAAEPVVEASTAGKEPAGAGQPKSQVLGEMINAGRKSLGEVFSTQSHPEDMATRLASARTQSLRRSIGINDKFLITSQLFDGDAAAYERTLDELEAFEDLDELMIHIHENYAWNPNREGTRVLIEVLTRKLS